MHYDIVIFHGINLFIFTMVNLYSFYLLLAIKPCRWCNVGKRASDMIKKQCIKVLRCYLLLLIALSSTFMYLQWDWILSDHNTSVGDSTSLVWLIFDYLLSFTFMASLAVINVMIRWQNLRRN
jgi:hypothetical protein